MGGLGFMEIIALKNKGIKKPLSNEPAEASPPKGVVLPVIIGRSLKNSNYFSFLGPVGRWV